MASADSARCVHGRVIFIMEVIRTARKRAMRVHTFLSSIIAIYPPIMHRFLLTFLPFRVMNVMRPGEALRPTSEAAQLRKGKPMYEFMDAMHESTQRSMLLKGFDISTRAGINAAIKYLQTEDPMISGFDTPPINYRAMGYSKRDADAANEMDFMMGELRVSMMLACLEEKWSGETRSSFF